MCPSFLASLSRGVVPSVFAPTRGRVLRSPSRACLIPVFKILRPGYGSTWAAAPRQSRRPAQLARAYSHRAISASRSPAQYRLLMGHYFARRRSIPRPLSLQSVCGFLDGNSFLLTVGGERLAGFAVTALLVGSWQRCLPEMEKLRQ